VPTIVSSSCISISRPRAQLDDVALDLDGHARHELRAL